MGKKMDGEIVEVDEINIIAKIPKNTARITIIAQYFDEDGDPVKVSRVLEASDIAQSRNDFLEFCEPGDDYDARYVITEEGRRFLEEMEKRNGEDM